MRSNSSMFPLLGLKRLFLLFLIAFITLGAIALPRAQAADYPKEFVSGPCPALPETDLTVACGTVTLPEDRADPDGNKVILQVAIIRGTGGNNTPLVYLDGGPGGSAVLGIEGWVDSVLLDDHDLILVDQRGTGYSLPSLNCIEAELGEEDASQKCRDRLLEQGINLNMYDSLENAKDIADLRVAMGYAEWDILGISYGTRLALTLARLDPTGIRSMIIDGVYPPNIRAYEDYGRYSASAYERLFAACAADQACAEAYPDLENAFYALVDSLNANPVTIQGVDPETGDPSEQEIDGNALVGVLFQSLYDTSVIPSLPFIIYEGTQGNYDALSPLFGLDQENQRQGGPDESEDLSDSEAMNSTVECADEVLFNDQKKALASVKDAPEALQVSLENEVRQQFEECEIWKVLANPTNFKDPVTTSLPVLVLNGALDPVTPPVWGELAAKTLPNSFIYTFPGVGHAATGQPCPDSIIQQFLADPKRKPDSSCIDDMKIRFEFPE
jgi:pimeloyl-ACP methyl ester carboxylesterase